MIWKGPHLPEPKEADIYSYVFRNVKQHRELPALLEYPSGREVTYRELVDQVERAASGLSKIGLKKGDVVAIVCPYFLDLIESVVAWFATLKLGAVLTLVQVMYQEEAFLLRQFKESKVSWIVTADCFLQKVKIITDKVGITKNLGIVVIGNSTDGYRSFSSLLERPTSEKVTESDANEISPNDLAIIDYTSGTTSQPKGALIPHKALIHSAQSLAIAQQDVTLPGQASVMIFGNVNIYSVAVNAGMKNILMDVFTKEKALVLQAALKLQVTFLTCSVDVTDKLARNPLPDIKDRFIWTGSAPLRRDVAERFYQAYQNTRLIQHYGSTEDGMVAVAISGVNGISAANAYSVGKPLGGVEIKILHLDTGEELGSGAAGELWVRSPGLMSGYLNRPEAEREVLKGGWYRTGDYGYADQDGFLYVTDRISDLVRYQNHIISPTELETRLCRHPGVIDAAVVAVPDEKDGCLPRAYLTKDSAALTEEEIGSYVEKNCEEHQYLRAGVSFVSSIPRTPTGKILRRLLVKNLI